jgi:hypothetical protein
MTTFTAPAPLPPWEDTIQQAARWDRDYWERDTDTPEDDE